MAPPAGSRSTDARRRRATPNSGSRTLSTRLCHRCGAPASSSSPRRTGGRDGMSRPGAACGPSSGRPEKGRGITTRRPWLRFLRDYAPNTRPIIASRSSMHVRVARWSWSGWMWTCPIWRCRAGRSGWPARTGPYAATRSTDAGWSYAPPRARTADSCTRPSAVAKERQAHEDHEGPPAPGFLLRGLRSVQTSLMYLAG